LNPMITPLAREIWIEATQRWCGKSEMSTTYKG
jgi:hypothetical protein